MDNYTVAEKSLDLLTKLLGIYHRLETSIQKDLEIEYTKFNEDNDDFYKYIYSINIGELEEKELLEHLEGFKGVAAGIIKTVKGIQYFEEGESESARIIIKNIIREADYLLNLLNSNNDSTSLENYLKESLKRNVKKSESTLKKLEKELKTYNENSKKIKEDKIQIQEILKYVSEEVIVGSFKESATSEKKTADILRNISLGIMVFIILIVGYSLLETMANDFSWEKTLVRLVSIILLTIPVTYLARESTRHRKQQYKHLQMALELNATTPYWNSLPKEAQDKLKIELSNKMFAQNNLDDNQVDSFPLNSQELISKLIDKIPTSSKD